MNIFGFIKLVALVSTSLYEIALKSISTHAIQAILTENVTDAGSSETKYVWDRWTTQSGIVSYTFEPKLYNEPLSKVSITTLAFIDIKCFEKREKYRNIGWKM